MILAVTGCQGLSLFDDPRSVARGIAAEHGFQARYLQAGQFTLLSFFRAGGDGGSSPLVVYIGGDGDAWKNRFVLARDPTPRDPQTLKLAVQEPAPNVVFLARPCQYTTPATARGCHPRYWAHGRYAEEVIEAISLAIDRYKAMVGAGEVELVGFSGGGTVAALIAARRPDIVGLTTVASNLDHAAWTAHHDLTPLRGSLNPADFAHQLEAVPQVHLAGEDDDVVPPAIIESYIGRMADHSRTRLIVMSDFGHDCCWSRLWRQLRAHYGFDS